MKRKLILYMMIIPGVLVIGLNTVLLGINEYYKSDSAVSALERGNEKVKVTNAGLADEMTETRALFDADDDAYKVRFTSPTHQQGFDAIVAGNSEKFPTAVLTEELGFDPAAYEWNSPAERDQAFDVYLADLQSQNEILPVEWVDENSWLLNTGIITLFGAAFLALSGVMLWKQDEGLPLTWAEAIVHTSTVFFFLILINGFIPDQILKLWDSVLADGKWGWFPYVADSETGTFVLYGTGWISDWLFFWSDVERVGLEWGWFVIRDILLTMWYGVATVGSILGIYWSQELYKRDKKKKSPAKQVLGTSVYGRPLLSGSE